MTDFLELRRISKRFGGVQALDGVDLAIAAGEVHCLVGENGSGKSTLIKIISGVQPPDPGGEIVVAGGQAHPALTPIQSAQLGIEVIYQDLALFPNLSVAENIAVTQHLGRPHLVRRARLREAAEAVVRRLGVALDPDARVGGLPIASRQLVAICRAMSADARLLIMDEPTASLTRQEVERLLALTLDLKRGGVTVVFVSHRLGEVMEIAERVTVLRDGRKVGTFDAADMDDRRLGVLMTGKEFHYEPRKPDPAGAEPVLSVRGLSRDGEYQDVSFEVRAGEIVGITGLLGAGRTELALSLFGVTAPDSGEIRLRGEPVRFATNRDAIARGIAYVPEDRLALGLVLEQPIGTNIVVTVLRQLARRLGLIPAAVREAAVRYWIRELAIKAPVPGNPVRTLSGGNQQRVVLSKWLARDPRLLILDSPTVGVDISAKDGIYEVVARLAAHGMAVILISDEIPEVYYHCHRILLMRDGRIGGSFVPHETTEAALEEAVNA